MIAERTGAAAREPPGTCREILEREIEGGPTPPLTP